MDRLIDWFVCFFVRLINRSIDFLIDGWVVFFNFSLAPLVDALYQTTHPELVQYLYLFAPISLVILNPIGFCLLELQKEWSNADRKPRQPSSRTFFTTAWNVLKGIAMNPINFMTFIGIAANFAFQRELPGVLDSVLATFGAAFSASALFYLGLKMVGRVAEFSGFRLVVPVLLILAKL